MMQNLIKWIGMCKDSVVLDDRQFNRSDIGNQTELNRKVKNFIHIMLT